MRLRWIATHRGIKAVEKSLESDATFPRLSPDQQFDLWLDLMKQLQVEDERKKLGSRLWHQYPEKAQRIKLSTILAVFCDDGAILEQFAALCYDE